MNREMRISVLFALLLLCGMTSGATVNVGYSPPAQIVGTGDVFEIQLVVSSNGPGSQPFAALDALIGYDPTKLMLLDFDKNDAGASFFVQGFLPDPDGINLSIEDGLALFTALAPPGNPVPAPETPGTLVVTSLVFIALAETEATNVVLVPNSGSFGETRVLLGPSEITGDTSGIAVITILPEVGACCLGGCGCEISGEKECALKGGVWQGPDTDCAESNGVAIACASCPGDVTLNGVVDVDDLLAIINSWGPPSGACQADIDNNGIVDVDDLLIVINGWGACR